MNQFKSPVLTLALATAATLSATGCGIENSTSLNKQTKNTSDAAASETNPETMGIQASYYTVGLLNSSVGYAEATMPDGSTTRCSGVYVSVPGATQPQLWFVTARHCLFPHDPLGRPAVGSLANVPLMIRSQAGAFGVSPSNRLSRDDALKINVTGHNATGLPICTTRPATGAGVELIGFGGTVNFNPRSAVGIFSSMPPANGPDLSRAFSSGMAFVMPLSGHILYGDPGDSGGPVIRSLGYRSNCVVGIMSRQYPLRHDGFGITGITILDSSFTDPLSWKAL